MNSKTKAEDPNKLGVVKFLTWSARDVSLSANVIVLGFLTIYCTNYLNMNALVVGTLLMASKIVDAFTNIFGGFLIDRTNTRWGKGRPYEFAILGVWFCTWLLFSAPAEASGTVKCIWIFVMYMFVNSIFTTLLNASGNAYMVRAFGTDAQRVKLASYGGIAIMIGAILVNMLFPVAMAAIATTTAGWSRLVALFAVPLALIGILRFFFVKETVKVDTVSEKVKIRDVLTILKENKYVYTVLAVQFVYAFVTGTGVSTYYYTYIVKNVSIMGFVSASSVIVLPVMIFFPAMLKKMYKSTMMIGCIHHDNGVLGACEYPESADRKILRLKEAGFNAIRSAHNPCSEAILSACDRYGMYVMDETWDMWGRKKNPYDYATVFAEHYKDDIRAIAERDCLHACVVMYSIGNEVSEPVRPEGVELAGRWWTCSIRWIPRVR